jgi:hypothetical protein
MPQIRMDFAAQEQAINAVKVTTHQITQHLQEMKQLHESNQAYWPDGGGLSYGEMAATHTTALTSAGDFSGNMQGAMSSSLVAHQGAVAGARAGILSTPTPQNIT